MSRAAVFLRSRNRDVLVAVVIFVVAAGYVLAWPPVLNLYDESIYLYEALRVLRGEVMYRDFFDITAPAFPYAMAGVYRLFGPTVATAKAAMAVVHGGIGVAVYGCTRALGVARELGLLASLTSLTVAYVALPQASPHWVGTLLTLLLVLLVLRMRVTAPPTSWLLPGLVVGTLAVFQQQKGAIMAAGLVATIVARRAAARRLPGASRVLPSVVWLGAGMAVVTMPAALVLLAAAGPGPVAEALVDHYVNYARINPSSFDLGGVAVGLRLLLVPPPLEVALRFGFLLLLPLVVPACGVWAIWSAIAKLPAVSLLSAATLALFTVLSVAYSLDLCHLGIVSPVLVVLLALMVDRGLTAASRPRLVVFACVTLALSGALVTQHGRAERAAPGRYDSPFGHVALASPDDGRFFAAVRARMRAVGSDEIFAYPQDAGVYLLTGGRNLTRFQILLRDYDTPAQWSEVYRTLDAHAVPFVLVSPYFLKSDDPFRSWLRERYVPAQPAEPGPYQVFQRARSAVP